MSDAKIRIMIDDKGRPVVHINGQKVDRVSGISVDCPNGFIPEAVITVLPDDVDMELDLPGIIVRHDDMTLDQAMKILDENTTLDGARDRIKDEFNKNEKYRKMLGRRLHYLFEKYYPPDDYERF
jgi:hypothetical protein